jgi:hypothetical protein
MRFITSFQLGCRFVSFPYVLISATIFNLPSMKVLVFFWQTIAVIPVCPHGVLQLGSSLAVSPRYSVVSMC